MEDALSRLRGETADVILAEFPLAGWTPSELLEAIQQINPRLLVVIRDPEGTVADAVRLVKLGAYHFMSGPLDENELIEFRHDDVFHVAAHDEQHHVAQFVDVQIRDHPALRGQVCGVAALARLERHDIVRQQSLKIRRAVGAGDDNPAITRAIDHGRSLAGRLVPAVGTM